MKLSEATDLLRSGGIADAKREARMLFSELGGIPYAKLVCEDAECCEQGLIDAVTRRAERYPLQYLLGKTDFYRESYLVCEDCLIPRSDTEILVDYAVRNIPEGSLFVDLCTGSGCVALSTLNNTKNTRAVAVDLSEVALRVAKRNAERLGLESRVDFLLADATDTAVEGEIFALLSNPPYVTEKAYSALEPELYSEPKMALVAEDEGLAFYKKLVPLYKDRISKDGFMAFEIGYDQADALKAIAGEHEMSAEIIKDYSGNDRVAVLKKI